MLDIFFLNIALVCQRTAKIPQFIVKLLESIDPFPCDSFVYIRPARSLCFRGKRVTFTWRHAVFNWLFM